MTTSQATTVVQDPASVYAAIKSRFSCRAFRDKPVARSEVEEILRIASWAASSTNTQPWKVYVLQDDRRDALVAQVCSAHDAVHADPTRAAEYREDYGYYPSNWVSPYIDRRRRNGWSLYSLLGIRKGEKDKMHAPVGLMLTIDRVMGRGSLLNYGMFMQNIMLAARARGLHTYPQAAWNHFAKIVLPFIGAGTDEMLVCGMSLDYADESALVNTLDTPRETMVSFTRWV